MRIIVPAIVGVMALVWAAGGDWRMQRTPGWSKEELVELRQQALVMTAAKPATRPLRFDGRCATSRPVRCGGVIAGDGS